MGVLWLPHLAGSCEAASVNLHEVLTTGLAQMSVSKCHFMYKIGIPVLPAPNMLLRQSLRVLEKWFEKLKG